MAEQNFNNNSSAAGAYLELYGLTREPFIGDMFPSSFYPGATREQRLNLLLHLIPMGEILLITGVPGIGKTTLLEQFLAKGKESWRVCRLDASAGLDSNQLLQQLVQAFSPEIAGQADRTEMERLLVSQLQSLRKSAQQPMLLIDNAQYLPESGLRALSKFIIDDPEQEKLFGVVLFSEPDIEEKLNNPALQALRAQIKHTFELPLLSEEETLQYLEHRIQSAGLQAESPFTAGVNKAIFGASQGLPVKINELAQAVIQNKQPVATPSPVVEAVNVDQPKKGKSRRISLAVVWPFAVAGVLASVLVFQDEINSLFSPPAEQDEASAAKEAIELSPTIEKDVVQRSESVAPTVVAPELPRLPESDVTVPEVEVQSEEVTTVDVDALEAVEPVEVIPLVVEKTETIVPAVIEPVVIEPAVATLPVAALVVPAQEEAVKEVVIAPVKPVEPKPAVQKPDWVSMQPPQAYTLQIVAQEKLQKREAFITRFDLENGVERFSTNKKGVRWYVAAIGVYGSRTKALEASRQLPEGVVPWVRSFASIQKELWQESPVSAAAKSMEKPSSLVTVNDQLVLTADEQWVLARSPKHYVLQLAAFPKEAKTRGFITNHRLQGSGKLVRLINNDRLWYVAVYGDVAERSDALQLADTLVNREGVSRPWVRSFDSLQRAVEKIQQK